ncbi:MAG: hypothetical protein IJ958_08315 [Agathobacter sp.]|nr:hypothetical protein [Agathobacter sp.]
MKYMTFNSSCSYAGIANMLEQYGIDTSDREIALEMKLPYLFDYQDGVYLSGPMLQKAEWFDIYLNPIGFQLIEKKISAAKIVDYLKEQKTAMLGIKMGNAGKHAVVYKGMESNELVFLNNKREDEDSSCEIRFTEEELRQNVETEVVVATLQPINPRKICILDKLESSIVVLQENLSEVLELCGKEVAPEVLRSKLNTLFRPLFLDGITMLNLIGETEISDEFSKMQGELLRVLRQDITEGILLKDYISMDKLRASVQKYMELIKVEIEKLEV